jgi:hypothetical protein
MMTMAWWLDVVFSFLFFGLFLFVHALYNLCLFSPSFSCSFVSSLLLPVRSFSPMFFSFSPFCVCSVLGVPASLFFVLASPGLPFRFCPLVPPFSSGSWPVSPALLPLCSGCFFSGFFFFGVSLQLSPLLLRPFSLVLLLFSSSPPTFLLFLWLL